MTTTLPVPVEQTEDSPDAALDQVQAKLDELRQAAFDAVTDTRRIEVAPVALENPPTRYDRVQMFATTPQGRIPMRLLEGAHEQISEKTGIPWKYYERMLTDAPELLARNINHWHQGEPGKRLVRMLKPLSPADQATAQGLGTAYSVRAILSDRYRVLDHGSLLNTILPVAREARLAVTEWALTEKHFFVRFKAPDEQLGEILPQMFEGVALRPGFSTQDIAREVLGFGVALRNSETGHGALKLEPLFQVKRCLNRIIVDYYDKVRAVHIGGRLDEQEGDFYAADTRTLDSAAVFLKVRDRLGMFFSGDAKQKAAQVLLKGMGTPIDLPEEVGQFEFIGNIAESFDLSEQEQKVLMEEVVAELQFTGRPLTPFAISQGITATARRIGVGEIERKDELEHLGWKVLDDPVEKLVKAAQAAARKN